MLAVSNLNKVYEQTGKHALMDACFSMERGEMVGLIGPNGAGKSTLMKTICKFIKPTSGVVTIHGENIFTHDNQLKDVGILLEPVFFDQLTAFENLAYYLRIHKKDDYLGDIPAHLEMVGLGANAKQKPKDFSFGMRQRLGLAMALLGKPQMLILDEPFVGLDPNGMSDLIHILKDRVKEDNICAMISSHQLYELASVCKRTIVVHDGQIVFDGIPELRPTIRFYLEGAIQDSFGEEVEENTLITRKTGTELHTLMHKLMQNNKIINIESSKSSLEQFFEE